MASGGKGGTQQQIQNIDPDMRKESESQMDLARLMASWGFTPYKGNTKADMTDATRAAHEGVNDAASAFGMSTAESAVPVGEEDASGIRGWSKHKMAEKTEGYNELTERIKNFAAKAGQKTETTGGPKLSGGKK